MQRLAGEQYNDWIIRVTSNTFFFRILHYVREVTRWFLSSASKLFLIVIYNQINLFDI
jgi:hypothetical protein